jgi:hypothetical protein
MIQYFMSTEHVTWDSIAGDMSRLWIRLVIPDPDSTFGLHSISHMM